MKYQLKLVIEDKKTFKVDRSYVTLHDGAIVDENERIYELYTSWFEPIKENVKLPEITEVQEIEEDELLLEEPVEVAELEEEVQEIEEDSKNKEDELAECKDREDINAFVKKYDITVSLGNTKNIDKLKAKVSEVL